MKFPVALQLYSVRDAMEKDLKGTLAQVKAMGYDGAELAGLYGYSAVEMKAMLEEAGLKLMSAHVPVTELLKDEVLDDYAATGLKFIVIPWMEVAADDDSFKADIAKIQSIGERCKARGMQLLYHNHDFEFQKKNGEYVLDIYYSSIPSEFLQTEIDTCWANVGGENPAQYVKKYSGKAPIVHLKDFEGEKSDNMYALIGRDDKKENSGKAFGFKPVGYGVQNFPAIVEAAEAAGTQWLVVEMDSPSDGLTSLECAEKGINYLKTIL
ncbi:MAG: sugar phosphate isomerase/epimerase [Clostridia bacterium]|nr:sugar phosphate isomerase/epimerase [Clostridia bacterium]